MSGIIVPGAQKGPRQFSQNLALRGNVFQRTQALHEFFAGSAAAVQSGQLAMQLNPAELLPILAQHDYELTQELFAVRSMLDDLAVATGHPELTVDERIKARIAASQNKQDESAPKKTQRPTGRNPKRKQKRRAKS